MSRWLAAAVVCLGAFGTDSLLAHHSAILFDLSKTFTMSGTLTKVDWRNPHVAVFVDVTDEAGRTVVWEFETGAPSWFRGRNVGRADFEKAMGQPVSVEVVRAKDGTPYGYLYKITFADGHSMELR
jgi:hypothetical protein